MYPEEPIPALTLYLAEISTRSSVPVDSVGCCYVVVGASWPWPVSIESMPLTLVTADPWPPDLNFQSQISNFNPESESRIVGDLE